MCNKYFPEWSKESSLKLLLAKSILIIFLVLIMLGFEQVNQQIFTSSEITWETLIETIIFNIVAMFLVILYIPYQFKIAPLWFEIIIILLWLGTMCFLAFETLILDNSHYEFAIDTDAIDVWTIVHTLAGVLLGFVMPFVWMFLLVTVWEFHEGVWTTGLGDGESLSNHIVDVIVAIVGWTIVIMIFSRNDIPWISSRNACNNDRKICKWKQFNEQLINKIFWNSNNNKDQSQQCYLNEP